MSGEEVNYQQWFDLPALGRRYMDVNYFPYYGEDNEILGFAVNRRNITEWKQGEQELELLLNFSRQASTEANLDDLLFFIANKIVEVIPPAEAASAFLYDEEKDIVHIQAWAGYDGSDVKGIESKVADSQIGRILHAKKPTLIEDVSADPDLS